MKDTMKNVFNAVFSFGGFMIVAISALFLVLFTALDASSAKTRACYNAGLIKVNTDAGSYCVAPANLVEIK